MPLASAPETTTAAAVEKGAAAAAAVGEVVAWVRAIPMQQGVATALEPSGGSCDCNQMSPRPRTQPLRRTASSTAYQATRNTHGTEHPHCSRQRNPASLPQGKREPLPRCHWDSLGSSNLPDSACSSRGQRTQTRAKGVAAMAAGKRRKAVARAMETVTARSPRLLR